MATNDLSEIILRNARSMQRRIAFRLLGSLAFAALSFYGNTSIERVLFWIGIGGALFFFMLLSPVFGEHLEQLLDYAREHHSQIAWIEVQPRKRGQMMVWLRSVHKRVWPIMMPPADAEALAARWRELVPGLYLGPNTPERNRAWLKDPTAPLRWSEHSPQSDRGC